MIQSNKCQMNCLAAAKYNPDRKIISFPPQSRSDIWSCIMFVWAFMKDYFYIKIVGPGMLGFWNVRFGRDLTCQPTQAPEIHRGGNWGPLTSEE